MFDLENIFKAAKNSYQEVTKATTTRTITTITTTATNIF